MLTGITTNPTKSRSLTASTSTIGERSKDALVRINELIRQNSVQDVENKIHDEVFTDHNELISSINSDKQQQQQRNDDISPIQFYINETKKLTNNLENSVQERSIAKQEDDKISVTNTDEINVQQVNKVFFLLILSLMTDRFQ